MRMEEYNIKIEEEPEASENKNGDTPGTLDLKVEIEPEFSYIDFHADGLWRVNKDAGYTPFSFFKSIEVINTTGETIPGLALVFSFENEALSSDQITLPPCPSPAGCIRLPWLKVKKPIIDKLVERVPCALSVSLISIEDEKVLATVNNIFNILPIAQPTKYIYSDWRLLAKYVTPLAPSVKQIANKAVLYNDGNPIVAYQNKDSKQLLLELQAIYKALHNENLLYQNPPANDSLAQRVRMPEESTRDKKATCLDSSILCAAVLEEVGFHPIIIAIDGHAFCGVFLNEKDGFEGGITNALADVTNRIAKGSQVLALFETTFITNGHTESFQEAMDVAKKHLSMYQGSTFNAIDIFGCHKGSIFSAIPTDGNDFELENYIKQKEIDDKDLNPIINDNREYENVEGKFEMDRFKTWERKLLDLSENNRLVSFKANANTCVRLLSNGDFFQALLSGDEINLSVVSLPQTDIVSSFMKSDEKTFEEPLSSITDGSLLTFGLEKTLKNLINKAKSALEETGASPLYLSLGVLNFMSPKSHKRIIAPFFLLPISIKRASGGKRYVMSYDVGDLRINETFFEYYKLFNPDVNFNSILGFDDLSKYAAVVHTFKEIAGNDLSLEENYFFISNLSFAHQVMWLDMVKRKDELKKNIIIKSIVDNQSYLTDKIISESEPVEELEKYEDFAAPLYYDSSQLKAILDCGAGKSFILDGPPGTGKSQTIVNMIANAFYNDKKILFVAEKKAALDVVANRLEKLGLGNYYLELHSNKATKADFFSKLGVVMEFGPTKSPKEYQQKCVELTLKKNKLREKINKMHNEDKYFMSLYECIVAIKQFAYLEKYKVSFNQDYLKNFTKEKYEIATKLIDTYISFSKGVHNFDSNILKAIGIQKINFINDRQLVEEELSTAIENTEEYLSAVKTFLTTFPFKVAIADDNVEKVFKLYDFAYNHELLLKSFDDLLKDTKDVENTFVLMSEMLELKEKFNKEYDIDRMISNVDIDRVAEILRAGTGLLKKIKAQKEAKCILQPFTKYQINNNQLGYIIVEIHEYLNKKKQLKTQSAQFERMTGLDAYDSLDALDLIEKQYNDTKEFLKLITEYASEQGIQSIIPYFVELAINKNGVSKFNYDLVHHAYAKYQDTNKLLTEKYIINKEVLCARGEYFEQLIKLLKYASDPDVFNDLVDLTNVNQLNNGFKQDGLYPLIHQVLIENCRASELHELLKVSLAYGFLSLYFEDEEINSFSPEYFADQIKSYKDAIKEYSETTVQCISAKISEEFARSDIKYSASGAIGRLKKSIANNGRGVSIRGTLSEFGDIILKYFPCFLMSPLSAAQYLSVDSDRGKAFSKFDIVIFDEASQIPTHEAVGPIARGNSLIIAGDPKQMPPSPYFSAGLQVYDDDDEENDASKFSDSPSLLDECISIEMPRHRLSYHYRSKHESLIQFSNDNFYNSCLYTFPSSSTARSCVEFKYVKTKSPKKDSSLSDEELKTILDLFKKIYTDPDTLNKSVGIISFNIKQADKITDSINEMLGNNKKLASAVEDAIEITKEPWFVKSIENVQGDERDIIILSVGFALTKAGYPNVRGPLVAGDNNGERRLNVAASRSKEKMIVISTIKASQFQDDMQIKNPGSRCLKHFLKYAEDCSFNLANEHDANESSILFYIKNDLEKRGFVVDANVGNSEFRVDLAIRDEKSTHYELGILIDTRPIINDISCRDKFYVQESVLNAMKWKIINIYSLEYFKYPNETIDKIVKAYNSDYVKQTNELNIKIEKADTTEMGDVFDVEDYPEFIPDSLTYSNDKGFDRNELVNLINKVINAFSPVSQNTIKYFIALACNVKYFKDKADKNIDRILNMDFGHKRSFDQTQYFYWKDDNHSIDKFRRSNGRSVDNIAKEEIACAMKQINQMQGGISREDLYAQLMDVLNFETRKVTRPYKERFDEAFQYAKNMNLF